VSSKKMRGFVFFIDYAIFGNGKVLVKSECELVKFFRAGKRSKNISALIGWGGVEPYPFL